MLPTLSFKERKILRDYIDSNLKIDGRMIVCRFKNAYDYLKLKNNWSDNDVENFIEDSHENYEVFNLINQILGLKHSHCLLRRTTHSCASVSDSLYYLKNELIFKLKDDFNYDFNEEWVDSFSKK